MSGAALVCGRAALTDSARAGTAQACTEALHAEGVGQAFRIEVMLPTAVRLVIRMLAGDRLGTG